MHVFVLPLLLHTLGAVALVKDASHGSRRSGLMGGQRAAGVAAAPACDPAACQTADAGPLHPKTCLMHTWLANQVAG